MDSQNSGDKVKLDNIDDLEVMFPLSVESISLDVEPSMLARDLRTIMGELSIVIRAGGLDFYISLSQLPVVGAKVKASGKHS